MSPVSPAFRTALLDPGRPVPEGLTDGAGRPAGRRFDVYRNNVAASLTEALEAGFPATASLLGGANFKGVAGAFLRLHPPASPRMTLYGADFPDFLDGFAPLAPYPYLGDVARLEYALRESYHAADHDPLDPAALAVAPDALMALRLVPAPSVRLVSSRWPVHALWAFDRAGGPKPRAEAQDVVILRDGFDPAPHLLPPGGVAFLRALDGRAALGDAVAAALDAAPGFDLAALLTQLLSHAALRAPQEGPTP